MGACVRVCVCRESVMIIAVPLNKGRKTLSVWSGCLQLQLQLAGVVCVCDPHGTVLAVESCMSFALHAHRYDGYDASQSTMLPCPCLLTHPAPAPACPCPVPFTRMRVIIMQTTHWLA